MPAPRSRTRARLAALVSTAIAVTGFQSFLAPQAAEAASSTIVINEVYVNGGSAGATYKDKYVELRNLTGSDISLTGKSIQYRSATGSGNSSNTAALTGTIPANGYYVVVGGSNGAVGTPVTGDQTSTGINPGGGGGTVSLVQGTTAVDPSSSANVIDKVGYGNSNTPEGTAASGNSVTKSLGRTGGSVDTDANAADFGAQAPTPGAANPGGSTGGISVTTGGNRTSQVGDSATGSVSASGGTSPYTFTATGLPTGVTLNADGTFTGTTTAAGTFTVVVTAKDSAATPAEGTGSFTWTVTNPNAVTPIAEIQGTGNATTLTGSVTTEGVVTAAYPTRGLNGFYIQKPGADTANASDAIFVYGGTSGFATYPSVGDSVRVTGTPGEFSGQTQITATGSTFTTLPTSLGTVTPKTEVPGTTCALPGNGCSSLAELASAREAMEGELVRPTAPWTVTDAYDFSPYWPGTTNSSGHFGEIGLAAESDKPLVAPTELYDDASADIANRTAYNNAHRIILDDGSSLNFTTAANQGTSFPWVTKDHAVRVGATVTFPAPVVFTEREVSGARTWRVLPSTPVTGAPTPTQPQFEQTRTDNQAPQAVGGDLKLATFNVLNFFPTTGEEYVNSGLGSCTYYTDREGNRITVNSCNPDGPRGAANTTNLQRQRDKIVAAINGSGADIVSLEELENSVKFGKDRDFAITQLVNALNSAAGAGTWAFPASPSELPTLAEQDVIRTGFIYKPASVALVGPSKVLVGSAPFNNAREPLAQAFKRVGQPDSEAFAVIVNHFKSKGSGTDDGTGQGNANPDRVAQAQALASFADSFKQSRGITKVFLVGDFNAYSNEDPIQTLNAAGYQTVESSSDPSEETYNFDGSIGSLDHVLANSAAHDVVTGADVWAINGYESVYYEYSRFNYNLTNLYDATPFRSSDHSPELVGIEAPVTTEPATRDINILATNDFHGRIQNDASSAAAGAAVLAGAVKQEKAANPDTVFAAAGDLIGASTFESFIAKDKPTIDALNSAGLEVSAAGNHEFDQGYDDLVNRVMAPYDATTNPYGGANWEYIAANVRKKVDNTHALAPTWTKDFGSVRVGFIGAVTEHLPELVSPSGIADIKVTDIVQEVNAAADDLVADDADVIVLLVHEGAAGTNCDTMDDDPTSDFGSIITGVNDEVDAIVSGHTHLEYNCSFPVAGWAADATHPVKDRPVVSAGQYGAALNKLVFKVDTATGQVLTKTQSVLKLKVGTSGSTFNYPADPATAQIVSAAVENAKVLGAQPLGKIGGPFYRGKLADGTTENRGAESTLGNLVAEAQRWATRNEESGSAQIAFMNPGGLRADMVGDGTGAFPRTLTYKQAADVQSFANTLVNMRLTGAQIKTVLEQQWQPTGASRPFLKLGISKGFTYTFDDTKAVGSRITGMWLNGTPINPTTSYSVTANSFLAGGGDNFLELANGTQKRDTGKVDLSAMVDYMAAFGSGSDVVPVDYKQNGVGVAFPADAPASYHPGDHVTFNVSSWSMTHPSDVKDTAVVVMLGDTPLGSFPLDNTAQSALPGFDTTGKASVDVVLPAGVVGPVTLVLSGAQTGTTVPVTVQVKETSTTTATDASAAYGQPVQVPVTVTGGTTTPTGTVTLLDGLDVVGTGTLGADGKVTITVEAGVLEVGTASLVAVYGGDATHEGSQDAVTVTVTKATASVNAPDVNVTAGSAGTVVVSVTATGVDPTGTVTVLDGAEELGSAEVTDGQATITLPVVADGTTLVAQYEGDEHVTEGSDEFTVHVGKAAAGVTAGDVAVQYGKAATVSVQVTAPAGVQATGTVTVRNGGTVLGSGPVNGGTATVVLPARSLPAGVATLTAEYGGNADLGAGTDSFTVTVAKATSVTEAKVSPKKPKKGKKVKVSVTVTATDGVPTAGGKVTIRVKGKDLTATVGANGKVKVNLGKLKKGSYKVKVVYLGSDNVAGSTDTVKFRVR